MIPTKPPTFTVRGTIEFELEITGVDQDVKAIEAAESVELKLAPRFDGMGDFTDVDVTIDKDEVECDIE